MAPLWEEIPGSSARAEECLEKLLAVDPRSEDALRSLERLYYAERKWSELIEACRRHAELVPAPNAGEIRFQIGAIYEHELRDYDKAIDAYLDVETSLPNHGDTMESLTRVYQKTSQWQKAADVLERRAQLAEVKSQRLELHFQAGEIYAEKLGDAKAAEARFVRALEVDPTHVPAMTALVEIYRKNGEFLKAAKLLVEAVPHTPNRLERTRLLVEAGEIYDGLDDKRKATELYLDALAVDPEHVEAGERVAELLWKAERYAELVPILEMLTRKEAEPALQVERLTRLAHAAHALGLDDKVGKAYARAAEIDETHLEAQRGRAAWHEQRSEWKEALAALEKVLEHHAEDLPPSERVELYYSARPLRARARRQGQGQRVHRQGARDRSGASSVAARVDGAGRGQAGVAHRRQEGAPGDVDQRRREGAAATARSATSGWTSSATATRRSRAWREGLELKGDNHKLLHKCLDAYVEEKAWPQALEMLERLIDGREGAVGARQVSARGGPHLPRRARARGRGGGASVGGARRRRDARPLVGGARRAAARSAGVEGAGALLSQGAQAPRRRVGRRQRRQERASGCACGARSARSASTKLGERESALAALEVALTFERGNLERHKQLADLYVQAGPG